jgi:hypothetical protein
MRGKREIACSVWYNINIKDGKGTILINHPTASEAKMARKRRSFPIPISTNFADRSVQEQVILDLVHKHPRGPDGTLTKSDYHSYYTDPGLRGVDGAVSHSCGYRPIDLYRMALKISEVNDPNPTSEWDYSGMIRSMFPDVGPRGVTRRSRRIAARVGQAVRSIKRAGLPGIWDVNWGYDDTEKARVHANNEEDAKNMTRMFFGPLIKEENEWRVSATFQREGSPLELLNANDPMLKGFDRLIERAQARIKEAQATIEAHTASKSFVQMYALNCMEVAGDVG